MKKIKVRRKNYYIPETWYDITLDKFLEVKDLELIKGKITDSDWTIQYVSILTGIPEEDLIVSMSFEEVLNIARTCGLLMTTEMPKPTKMSYTINGIEYKLDDNVKLMTYGQFVDLEMVTTKADTLWEVAHIITASFMREVTGKTLSNRLRGLFNKTKSSDIKKYDYNEIKDNADIFYDKLPMPYIYTTSGFFLTLGQDLLKNIEDSSQETQVEMNQE